MYAFFWPDREAMDHLSTLLEEDRVGLFICMGIFWN